MNSLIISIIAVLSVIFLIILLDALLRKTISYTCTELTAADTFVEAKLRTFMKNNPNAEIIVLNKSTGAENAKILQKLASAFPEIHILNCK